MLRVCANCVCQLCVPTMCVNCLCADVVCANFVLSFPPCGVPGVAQGTLGVTGIETSANYVEEQKPGVYRQTVRYPLLMLLFCIALWYAAEV
jgi:hypothetical protein